MLILTRKLGEQVLIGDSIAITVLDIDSDKVRLGIEVPRDVPVYRPDAAHGAKPKDTKQGGES